MITAHLNSQLLRDTTRDFDWIGHRLAFRVITASMNAGSWLSLSLLFCKFVGTVPFMEQWRAIPGYEGAYEVSDEGRVRSLDRAVRRVNPSGRVTTKAVTGKVLSPRLYGGRRKEKRRLYVPLSRDGSVHAIAVAHAVLIAFDRARKGDEIALHWDDDCRNNRLSNLRWGTHVENAHDTVRNGNHHNVKKTHCPRGHEYTEKNTRIDKRTGGRLCRACAREKAYERYHAAE